MTLAEAFKKFAAKAPVNLDGPQRTAWRAWSYLKPHLTLEEIVQVNTALSHAKDTQEGRGEFDDVMQKIGLRLMCVGINKALDKAAKRESRRRR